MNKDREVGEMKMALVDYALDHNLPYSFETYRRISEVLFHYGFGSIERAQAEKAKEIFVEMYKLVKGSEEESVITISSSDIKAIAKRYGVNL